LSRDTLARQLVANELKGKGEPMANKPPIHELRLGRIKALVWENDTTNGTRHSVTVARLFKDGDTWKETTSFGRDDLLLVAKIVDQAHDWIFEHGAQTKQSHEAA
jgi:hypothetical protein